MIKSDCVFATGPCGFNTASFEQPLKNTSESADSKPTSFQNPFWFHLKLSFLTTHDAKPILMNIQNALSFAR